MDQCKHCIIRGTDITRCTSEESGPCNVPTSWYAKAIEEERDRLSESIAEAARKAGIYNGEVSLSITQLIMLCDDLSSTLIDNGINLMKREEEALNWAKIAGNNQKQINKLSSTLAEAIEYIKRLNDELADERESADEAERELAEAREALQDIKLWCEGSTCEVCGKKEMTETDCYDYAKAALAGKEKDDEC